MKMPEDITTYIDTATLGPSIELATVRAQALGLGGYLLPADMRWRLLCAAREGDTIISGVRGLNYWRCLPDTVNLVSIEAPDDLDPLTSRIPNKLTWLLVQRGVPLTEAKNLVKSPPKTLRHKRFQLFAQCEAWLDTGGPYTDSDLPTFDYIKGPTQQEQTGLPYSWRLVEDDMDIALFWAALYLHDGPIGIDVETDQVGEEVNEVQDTLVGVGIAIGTQTFYAPISYEPWLDAVRQAVPDVPWVGANAKFDLVVMLRYDIHPGPLYGDCNCANYLLGGEGGLKDLTFRLLGIRMVTYEDMVGKGKRKKKISECDPQKVAAYCGADAYFGVATEALLRPELNEKQLELYLNIDLPLVGMLGDMELEGIHLDRDACLATLAAVMEEQERLGVVINQLALDAGYKRPDRSWTCQGCRNGKVKKLTCTECNGVGIYSAPVRFNLGSPQQLVGFFHRHLGIPVQRISRTTQQPSCDRLALLRMRDQHVSVPLTLKWKQLEKHRAFLWAWYWASEKDDKLHTVFTNTVVKSSRFSSRFPNLTQVAVKWRDIYDAGDPSKVLVAADYAQVEVRVAAYVSHDPTMLAIVQADPSTEAGSIHCQNVTKLFGAPFEDRHEAYYLPLKTRAKNYFFGAMYGSLGYEVHDVLEKQILDTPELEGMAVPALKEIMRSIRELHDIYGRYFQEWIPFELYQCRERGNIALTLYGRPRMLPDLTSPDQQLRKAAERNAISHLVQGTATGDVVRQAMLKVRTIEGGRVLLVIHDEILSLVDKGVADRYIMKMVEAMELGQPFEDVPLIVEAAIAYNWKDTHG